MLMIVYFHQNQAEYLAHTHGFGAPDVWAAKETEFRELFTQPGIQAEWASYRGMLGRDFVEFVDDLMSRPAPAKEPS